MSEKPQVAQDDEQDILEQIIAQGLEKMKAPTQTEAREEAEAAAAPRQESSGETATPTDRKHRRSAVYLYLLILFSAAFLMLLLAYFIQRRSNESTISDLKDSMNLSREELLDEIRELEGQVRFYQSVDDNWMSVYLELEEKHARLAEENEQLARDYYAAREEVYSYSSFLQLDRYYQAGDYESCAAILILQMQGQYSYHAPEGTDKRQEEIVRAVVGAGILKENFELHPDEYEDLLEDYFNKFGVLIDSAQWAG